MKAAMLLMLLLSTPAHAEGLQPPVEPYFCDPAVFVQQEIVPKDGGGIKRLHAYRLGGVVLSGMAIGASEAGAVESFAGTQGATPQERFCTWYVNKGNTEAERTFRHIYLPDPSSLSPEEAAERYAQLLAPAFAEERGSIWWCLEQQGFIAVGCNGQLHRGPTVFGMVLAALGCSAENAAEIVNRIWGLNGVPPATRLAAIKQGAEAGARSAALRSRVQRRLSAPPGRPLPSAPAW